MPAPSPAPPAPSQPLAGRWVRQRLPLPRGSSAPAFARLSREPRGFTAAGTGFRGRSRPRVGARGSGGRRGALGSSPPGSNRGHRAQSGERLRRLGGDSCGDRAVGLSHGLKYRHAGTLRPSPSSPGPGGAACGQRFGSPAGAGAGQPPPILFPSLAFLPTLPKPTLRSFHTSSVPNAANEPAVPGCGIHQGFG